MHLCTLSHNSWPSRTTFNTKYDILLNARLNEIFKLKIIQRIERCKCKCMMIPFLSSFFFSFFLSLVCFFLFRSLNSNTNDNTTRCRKLSYHYIEKQIDWSQKNAKNEKRSHSFLWVYIRYSVFVQTHTHVFYIFINRIFLLYHYRTALERFYAARYHENFEI